MTRMIVVVMMALALVAPAWADDADLLNSAVNAALAQAQASIGAAEKLNGVSRIGVATLESDMENVTDLVKTMLTKTSLNVVLTNDADWAPLLDEFARQVRREDLMLEDTAHKLRVQGVDAVLYGTVEKSGVEDVRTDDESGRRATVRLMLNIASLSEENPGSLLWSEQVEGSAEALEALAPEEQLVSMFVTYRMVFVLLGGVFVLWLLFVLYRRAITPR